jgi:hypothetical protein
MKNIKLFSLLAIVLLVLVSCGPVVVTSSPNHQPPAWFYPNRVEIVRYVYFPEYSIYYDLTFNNYLYQNNGVWLRVNKLPPQFNHVNLNRSKYIRVKGYRGDNIRTYHNENNVRRSTRSTRNTATRTNTTKTRRN